MKKVCIILFITISYSASAQEVVWDTLYGKSYTGKIIPKRIPSCETETYITKKIQRKYRKNIRKDVTHLVLRGEIITSLFDLPNLIHLDMSEAVLVEPFDFLTRKKLIFYNELYLDPYRIHRTCANFANYKNLQKVILPQTLDVIKDGAFTATNIDSITIPASVRCIGNRAFANCLNLRWVKISEYGELKIGEETFADCNSLREIVNSQNITYIGWSAFAGCSNLHSFNISVSQIAPYTFENCTNLSNVTFPSYLTKIGRMAFANSGLTSIEIPTSEETVFAPFAFRNCKVLTEVKISGDVISTGAVMFAGCSALKTVELSNNIRIMNYGVFTDCSDLAFITMPDSLEVMAMY